MQIAILYDVSGTFKKASLTKSLPGEYTSARAQWQMEHENAERKEETK